MMLIGRGRRSMVVPTAVTIGAACGLLVVSFSIPSLAASAAIVEPERERGGTLTGRGPRHDNAVVVRGRDIDDMTLRPPAAAAAAKGGERGGPVRVSTFQLKGLFGHIDLSNVTFSTAGTDDAVGDVTGGDAAAEGENRVVDVLIFRAVDSECEVSRDGGGDDDEEEEVRCNWPNLGVGVVDWEQEGDIDGDVRREIQWCCTKGAVDAGMCRESDAGRLIVDGDVFEGDRRYLNFPRPSAATGAGDSTTPSTKRRIKSGAIRCRRVGWYVVVFANCYENDVGGVNDGEIRVNGTVSFGWKNPMVDTVQSEREYVAPIRRDHDGGGVGVEDREEN